MTQDAPPQCPCIYCGFESYNVIEVRYARTLKHAANIDEEQAPREILGRGYYVCDGCFALLDYHVDHHLKPDRHGLYNVASAVYYLFGLWGVLLLGSLAGKMILLQDRPFQATGIVLAFLVLSAWFYRATVHSRYFAKWRRVREEPIEPTNSLGGFTDLRDKVNPELTAFLPVRFEDSVRLAGLPGSPPVRCVGPNGESWGEGPATNFAGRGDNEWYRAVWVSWRLWPLTHVLVPPGVEWAPPPSPRISEVEVAFGTLAAGIVGVSIAFLTTLHPVLACGLGAVAFPIGWVAGTFAREQMRRRDLARSTGG